MESPQMQESPQSSRLDDARILIVISVGLAFLPRLFLLARLPGNDISLKIIESGKDWAQSGQWRPFRSPGSPMYEYWIGMLANSVQSSSIPAFVFANILSALCVAASLYLLYWIFREGLSPRMSLLGVALFNFYPHEWVLGASTTDVNFMMLFGIASVFALMKDRTAIALILCFLAVGSRIQALALAFPLLAAACYREWRARKFSRLLLWPVLSLLFAAAVFFPSWRVFGWNLFSQPYHRGEFSKAQEIGAFLLRAGNMLGPLGLVIAAVALLRNERRMFRECSALGFVALGTALLTFCVFALAPWETFYLLPIVPGAIFLVLRYTKSPAIVALFAISALLPNLIQVQIRPWKMPPYVIRDGVIQAHLREDWNTRGGG